MKRALGILAVIAVLVLAWFVWMGLGRPGWPTDANTPTPDATSTTAAGVPARPDDAFAMTVNYVYDGDTIQATVLTPNEVVTTTHPVRIRLIGIDTPEVTPTPECWAEEARTHLATLLPQGATVWAAPDRDTWDDYKRRLFNLWTDDGRFVNYEMVAAGDAEAIRVWPNVAYLDLLRSAQQDAEAARAGQWGACG